MNIEGRFYENGTIRLLINDCELRIFSQISALPISPVFIHNKTHGQFNYSSQGRFIEYGFDFGNYDTKVKTWFRGSLNVSVVLKLNFGGSKRVLDSNTSILVQTAKSGIRYEFQDLNTTFALNEDALSLPLSSIFDYDPELTFLSTASDGYLSPASSGNYTIVWSRSDGVFYNTSAQIKMGQKAYLTGSSSTLTLKTNSTPLGWNVTLGAGMLHHWEAVDTNDGATSYVYVAGSTLYQTEYFEPDDCPSSANRIYNVYVYARARRQGGAVATAYSIGIKNASGGVTYWGAKKTNLNSMYFVTASNNWTKPPWDASKTEWSTSDVNLLLIGLNHTGYALDPTEQIQVTEMYVVIYYVTYEIYRSFPISFDTSSLAGKNIISATLRLYSSSSDFSDTDFNVVVQNGTSSTYPHDPLQMGDYAKGNYSNTGGILSTASWTTSAYNDITLNATGFAMIDKSGYTRLCVRSSRDIAGTIPTATSTSNDDEYIIYYASEQGSGYEPQLLITTKDWTNITDFSLLLTARTWLNVGSSYFYLNTRSWMDISDPYFLLNTRSWNNIAENFFLLNTRAWTTISEFFFYLNSTALKGWNSLAVFEFYLKTRGWTIIDIFEATLIGANVAFLIIPILALCCAVLFIFILAYHRDD